MKLIFSPTDTYYVRGLVLRKQRKSTYLLAKNKKMMPLTMLENTPSPPIRMLYLHGFRSSPQSCKAQLLAAHLRAFNPQSYWACPMLNVSPLAAIATAAEILNRGCDIKDIPNFFSSTAPAKTTTILKNYTHDTVIVGSSLGGFYATWLAEQYGCRCVLLNPAIRPWEELHRHLGIQTLWHSEDSIVVERHHMDELKAFEVKKITHPQRYFLLAATGDQVINYRDMLDHYRGAQIKLIQGSDHGLSDFSDHIDEVLAFCAYRRTSLAL